MAEGQSSLAWKFTKAVGKMALVGGLSFCFGIAIGGLVDYHFWHEIAELKPVIEQTAWIKDWARAETIFGGSVVDGLVGLGNILAGEAPLPSADVAQNLLNQDLSLGPADF
jgi:hypothetical protein